VKGRNTSEVCSHGRNDVTFTLVLRKLPQLVGTKSAYIYNFCASNNYAYITYKNKMQLENK